MTNLMEMSDEQFAQYIIEKFDGDGWRATKGNDDAHMRYLRLHEHYAGKVWDVFTQKHTRVTCVDCDETRWVKPQDAFQVKRCGKCQKAYRKELDGLRRKAKRAKIGLIWVDTETMVWVKRAEKWSDRLTVELTENGVVVAAAVIEDGVDMAVTIGDKSFLKMAIRATEIFKDGLWDYKFRLEELKHGRS